MIEADFTSHHRLSLVDEARAGRSMRWFRSHLFGLPTTSRTAQWVQDRAREKAAAREREQESGDSAEDVARWLGIRAAG